MHRFAFVLFLAVFPAALWAETPRLATVTPEAGKPLAEFTTAGDNLEKANVGALYLTDGKNDTKVQVLEQTKESIKFKVPGDVKAGRYSLMLLTGDGKQYLEQPVKLTVE